MNIQIVVNDQVLGENISNRGVNRRLQGLLGTNTSKPSFFVVCKRGCRGKGAALHTKFVIDHQGEDQRRPATNLHLHRVGQHHVRLGNGRQYNDQFAIVGRADLSPYVQHDLRRARRRQAHPQPVPLGTQRPLHRLVLPPPRRQPQERPVWQALPASSAAVRRTPPGGSHDRAGQDVHVERQPGLTLARKLYKLDQAGCRVEVILGAPGAGVVREVRRPGRNGGIERLGQSS